MELKRRETIDNINFNGRGEKIKNAIFDEEKKDEESRLGKDIEFTSAGLTEKEKKEEILTTFDENVQKDVSISNSPDSSIAIANGNPLEDQEEKAKLVKFKKIVIFGGFLMFILLLTGAYFGLELRDVYLAKIPLEKVLKGNGQIVINLNSNADFEQYKYLDDNLRKFPGYKILEKELDDIGEGKTISQILQDKLAANNLSFDDDIKKVIGNKTIVVVPSITPFTNKLKKMAIETGSNAKNALRKRELEGKVVNAKDAWIGGDIAEVGKIKVLGLTSDFYAENIDIGVEKKDPELVDFIIGASIKNLKEAKRVIEKIKKDNNKYQVSEMKFEGYAYYKVSRRTEKENDPTGIFVNVKDTYHALIGGNWIMATKEADLKEMISARKANHLLSKITFWKKAGNKMINLENDGDYNSIKKDLTVDSQEGLLSAYLKVDYAALNLDVLGDSIDTSKKFFKMQEENLLIGTLFRVTPEGVVLRTSSNQINLIGVENVPIETGLIQKMPKQVGHLWADGYFETSKFKNMYYSFKKNNLTQEGVEAINEAKESLKQEAGVDFDIETDFIDHFSGDIASGVLTGNGVAPQAFMIVEIDDELVMLESMQKVVEIFKVAQLMPYKMTMMDEIKAPSSPVDLLNEQDAIEFSTNLSPLQLEVQAEYAKKIEEIQNSKLLELQTEIGTSYVYKFPGIENFSLNLIFSEGKMILGTDQDSVISLQKELGNGNASKLTKTEGFEYLTKNVFPTGYAKSFIAPVGIWNGLSYYMKELGETVGMKMSEEEQQVVSAIGTVFRTINSISSIQNASPVSAEMSFGKNSLYIEIKEVDATEKVAAEKILEKL